MFIKKISHLVLSYSNMDMLNFYYRQQVIVQINIQLQELA